MTGLARHGDVAIQHAGDDVVDRVQSEPAAALPEGGGEEGVEDPLQILAGDAHPVVADADRHPHGIGVGGDHDVAAFAGRKGMLIAVGEAVEQHPLP